MAKTYEGSVSIVLNTKKEIALKRDAEGKFTAANAAECYEAMTKLAKERKVSVNKYSLFLPEKGTTPVLLANQYGNPYIALLPPKTEGGKGNKGKVEKLA